MRARCAIGGRDDARDEDDDPNEHRGVHEREQQDPSEVGQEEQAGEDVLANIERVRRGGKTRGHLGASGGIHAAPARAATRVGGSHRLEGRSPSRRGDAAGEVTRVLARATPLMS